jgi:hypothetical protein
LNAGKRTEGAEGETAKGHRAWGIGYAEHGTGNRKGELGLESRKGEWGGGRGKRIGKWGLGKAERGRVKREKQKG